MPIDPIDNSNVTDAQEPGIPISVTEAQRTFACLLRRVREGEHIQITLPGHPAPVLLGVGEYERLIRLSRDALREVEADQAELDGLMAQMQTPAHRRGVDALFRLTGNEIGEAAHRAGMDRG